MALVSVDDSLVIKAARENPDARPVLKALFPSVFAPKIPVVGEHYVRGNVKYIVCSILLNEITFYFLTDIEGGTVWATPAKDPTKIFGTVPAEFKKCIVQVTYAEVL